MKTKNALKQAELILKLYEIRRETALRSARDYVGGEFQPKSVDEFVSLVKDGGKPSGHILQVYGYWDMVAAFVVHGALDESLIFDTCQEMYFQFEKIQPYLAGFRQKMDLPEFLKSMEAVVAGAQERRARAATKAKSPKQTLKASKQRTEPEDPRSPSQSLLLAVDDLKRQQQKSMVLQRCVGLGFKACVENSGRRARIFSRASYNTPKPE